MTAPAPGSGAPGNGAPGSGAPGNGAPGNGAIELRGVCKRSLDNVIAPVLPYRTSWDKRDRARQLLAAVGLAGRERSLPSRMSGGEQQRIAIARALIDTPAPLLADEPTGNLDSANATEILDLLADLRAEHHITMLLASHDPQVAARAERLIRLRDGAVIDDIQLTGDRPVQEIIRPVGQLG